MENKTNYIEGHEMKLRRIRNEKYKEKELDLKIIHKANEELERERIKKIEETVKMLFIYYCFYDCVNKLQELI